MINYFYASALVKRYVDEPGSHAVEKLLESGSAATARYSHVEILSAAARRYRDGDITAPDFRGIRAALRSDFDVLVVVELTAEVVAESERLLVRHSLRAGDALQLASCLVLQERMGLPVAFVAFDQRCNEAAAAEGLTLRGDDGSHHTPGSKR
ncbi:MAG: type II toxin-antitoxin system VapC family toxin [Anaerolineae bacterium]